jgi:hypothetical protein
MRKHLRIMGQQVPIYDETQLHVSFIHSFTGAYIPRWTFGLLFRSFLITHIQTHSRTPLDE